MRSWGAVLAFSFPFALAILFVVPGAVAQYATATPYPTPTPWATPLPTPASTPITIYIDSPLVSCSSNSGHGCMGSVEEQIQVIDAVEVGGVWGKFRQSMACPGGACGEAIGRASKAFFYAPMYHGYSLLVSYDNPPADGNWHTGGLVVGYPVGGYSGTLSLRWNCHGNWVVVGSDSPYMEAQCYQRIYVVARAVYRSFPDSSPTPTPPLPTPSPEEWWDIQPGLWLSYTIPITQIINYEDVDGGCLSIPGGIDLPGALVGAANALGVGIPDRISWLPVDTLEVCLTRRLITSIRPYPGSPNFAPVIAVVGAALMVAVVYSAIRRR